MPFQARRYASCTTSRASSSLRRQAHREGVGVDVGPAHQLVERRPVTPAGPGDQLLQPVGLPFVVAMCTHTTQSDARGLPVGTHSAALTARPRRRARDARLRAMRFGIFYEHQVPRPWDDGDEHRVFAGGARAVRARRPARHRLRLGGRAPLPRGVQPLERARGVPRRACRSARSGSASGTASCRCRPPFNHPARVAERIATLDLVSGGRVEFGTGESSVGGRARRLPHRPRRQARHVGGGAARRAPLPHRGAVHRPRRPPRDRCRRATSCPSRVQRPHPPVWVACSRRETIHLAAQNGIGALVVLVLRPRGGAGTGSTTTTRRSTREGVPIGDAVNANIACVTPFMCHPRRGARPSRAASKAPTSSATRSRTTTSSAGTARARTDLWAEYQAAPRREPATTRRPSRPPPRHSDRLGPRSCWTASSGLRGAVGTPAQVREYLRRYEEYGVDQVILASQAGTQSPRARHGEPRALRPRGAARVRRSARAAAEREGRAARAGDRRGDGAQAGLRPSAAADPDYEIPAIPRAERRSLRVRCSSTSWLDQFEPGSRAGDDIRKRLA